ncbi:hypothetical protein K3174_09275 [Qipengyuania sp. 6D47A]|uniref:Uncharacterized protein n=1 Tax=Qipengyuania qiaonensis TaxID=2867240 RepID=A0ABS7J5V7_9SPHN|nr:hypothetical protein [Qipengyuania qiaonensis]
MLMACSQSPPESVAMELPPALSNDFPGNNRPFGSREFGRLTYASKSVQDRFFGDLPDREKYLAMLDAETNLADLAPEFAQALGEDWIRDPDVIDSPDFEAMSFVYEDLDRPTARIAIVSVPTRPGTRDPKPAQIISSIPIEGLI